MELLTAKLGDYTSKALITEKKHMEYEYIISSFFKNLVVEAQFFSFFFRTGPPVNAFLNSETVRKLQDVPQMIGVEREGL